MSNFVMRDLQPGLPERAKKTVGFTERTEETETQRESVCADARRAVLLL